MESRRTSEHGQSDQDTYALKPNGNGTSRLLGMALVALMSVLLGLMTHQLYSLSERLDKHEGARGHVGVLEETAGVRERVMTIERTLVSFENRIAECEGRRARGEK